MAHDIDRWTCVQRTCKSYLKINNLYIIVDKYYVKDILYYIYKNYILKNDIEKDSSFPSTMWAEYTSSIE
jgi:hypothetical protein